MAKTVSIRIKCMVAVVLGMVSISNIHSADVTGTWKAE
jgi:hypothetical protein